MLQRDGELAVEVGAVESPDGMADERTIEATWRRTGALLDCFSPGECANYLVNSGYAPA